MRIGLLTLIVGLLLLDPLFCQAAEVFTACSCSAGEACGEDHPSCPSHNPCEETGHSCICRGATMARCHRDVLPLVQAVANWLSVLEPALLVAREFPFAAPATLREPVSGRSVRIWQESFLI